MTDPLHQEIIRACLPGQDVFIAAQEDILANCLTFLRPEECHPCLTLLARHPEGLASLRQGTYGDHIAALWRFDPEALTRILETEAAMASIEDGAKSDAHDAGQTSRFRQVHEQIDNLLSTFNMPEATVEEIAAVGPSLLRQAMERSGDLATEITEDLQSYLEKWEESGSLSEAELSLIALIGPPKKHEASNEIGEWLLADLMKQRIETKSSRLDELTARFSECIAAAEHPLFYHNLAEWAQAPVLLEQLLRFADQNFDQAQGWPESKQASMWNGFAALFAGYDESLCGTCNLYPEHMPEFLAAWPASRKMDPEKHQEHVSQFRQALQLHQRHYELSPETAIWLARQPSELAGLIRQADNRYMVAAYAAYNEGRKENPYSIEDAWRKGDASRPAYPLERVCATLHRIADRSGMVAPSLDDLVRHHAKLLSEAMDHEARLDTNQAYEALLGRLLKNHARLRPRSNGLV